MPLYRLPNLVSVENLPEHYISGIGMIEALGTNLRITMYTERYVGTATMPVPEVAFVGPIVSVPDAILTLQRSVSDRAAIAWSNSWRLLSGSHH